MPSQREVSRSRKQPIVKDKGIRRTDYLQRVRSAQKNELRKIPRNIDITYLDEDIDIDIPDQRVIVNDYDYCDYIFRDCSIKYTRK